jgi:hypothetical protein
MIQLCNELYSEGYYGGGSSDEWMKAWAVTAERVAAGAEYNDNTVIDVYNELEAEKPERN